jgi:uncharacterized membrane protein (UPF0127 family)
MEKLISHYKWPLVLFVLFVSFVSIVVFLTLNRDKSESPNSNLTITTSSDSFPLTIELAKTPQEQANGLMYRTELCEDCGMLFIYDHEQILTFWMKNTLISLDMIFINGNGEIVNIAQNTKINQTQERYSSKILAKYVLEVNGGWCKGNGVEIGDKVEFNIN